MLFLSVGFSKIWLENADPADFGVFLFLPFFRAPAGLPEGLKKTPYYLLHIVDPRTPNARNGPEG